MSDWIAQVAQAARDGKIQPPPDDPDEPGMNTNRASFALKALEAFHEATGSDLQDAIADLIGDLGHFCDQHGIHLADEIDRGREMYGFETQNEGKQFGTATIPGVIDWRPYAKPLEERIKAIRPLGMAQSPRSFRTRKMLSPTSKSWWLLKNGTY